jgi:hypothetical protein
VALGSPEDYLPPEGAFRACADDTHWKELFHRFARQSACIVAEIGVSANLCWEFSQIRQAGMQEKLFIFTPCSKAGYGLQWAFWNLLWALKGLHRARWPEFSKELGRLGFDIAFDDPGPGSVITFDAQAQGVLLTAQVRRPNEFVDPIVAWVRAREKTGRHVRVSCSEYGKPHYLCSTHAVEAGKYWCAACEMTYYPGVRARRILWRWVACVYWAYLLFAGFPIMAVSQG